ncbi:ROK family protein [Solicola gregarius]|uniref:ROK family protein n=1 Tax=Solicola gregarius TaxID=2908642 RepID=A0AA46TFH4_9ACTN|nr:ROK family protein [Solicola gregarius]UYM04146.1 ROK family protein [Solicola gregarius]
MTSDARDLVLAIDVGGTTIKSEIVDGDDRVVATSRVPTPHGVAALDAITDAGSGLIASLPADDRDRVTRAAVGLPGIVDRTRGVGVMSGNVGWRDLQIAEPLRTRWKIPVAIDHDVTLAGWAEWRQGAGRGVDDVCFVSIGTGIAAALVVGGRLVRGGASQAGELGHTPSRTGDRPCGCGGRGCLETIASASAIEQAYAERTGSPRVPAEDVIARRGSDPIASDVWSEAIAALADGLTHVTHAVSPSRVVLGGGLSGAGDVLTTAVHDAIAARTRVVGVPDVMTGAFGARAGIVGVALLARVGSTDNEA